MTPQASDILINLQVVASERARRRADPALAAVVQAIKGLQHARFENTYSDLLAQPRYARAARFFLDDLYGPHDFAQRDAEFVRIVPAMVKLVPKEVVGTVLALSELHALSESLDSRMGEACGSSVVDARQYAAAWQETARAADRERQIGLMLAVGQALERYTHNALLRHSLRLMRTPARAAGLGELQAFLETGFDTFREMRGASGFLATIADRERALAARLFAVDTRTLRAGEPERAPAVIATLGELP